MGHDDGADGITHPVEQNQTNEGDSLFIDWPYFRLVTCLLYFTNCVLNVLLQLGGVERREWERGPSMGHGLQKFTRARRGKLPLVINEGRTRPSVPLIAAKFATECNITVRNHIPVLKHWKEYKKHPALVTQIMGMIQVSTFSNHFPPLFCEHRMLLAAALLACM